jgi:alkanesulfonate monooxygenase SsuD/methylene tetrahydromethanopterin reductase-like flavin-dependent oxidoreductase (luciferase family)
MRVGLLSPSIPPFDSPRAARLVAELAEQHGADSLWVPEHVIVAPATARRTRTQRTGACRCRRNGLALPGPVGVVEFRSGGDLEDSVWSLGC